MMEGGARYSFGSVSLTGIGTLIDSLVAIREMVYERKQLSLSQLREALASDFAGEEALRQQLVRGIPKFGQEDETVREFSARVFTEVARVSSGKENTRGGRYEPSLFCFRAFTSMGAGTGATPDGRKAGEHLSPGMSPSVLALGRECSVGQC
jgi:formate C-acetyltransferase